MPTCRLRARIGTHEAIKIFIDQVQQYDALELEELWALASVLKFLLLEEIITQADGVIRDPDSHTEAGAELLKTRMRSLRDVGYADWFTLIEPLVIYDAVLQQDPANAYKAMDFDSREAYRKRVAEIARRSDCSELEVAQAALALALESREKHRVEDPRLRARRAHVGYYIIDRGFPQLAARVGFRPRFIDRLRLMLWSNADDFYIGGIQIITVVLIGLILAPLVPTYPIFGGLTLAFLLLLLPVTQGAVDLVNNTVTAIFKAYALPKLDFSEGVPEQFTTLVVVPTLLMKEKQVRELFDDLEVRYLANQDRNIHFGLLTDLPDSVTRPRQNDTDPLVELAIQLTDELNERYERLGSGIVLPAAPPSHLQCAPGRVDGVGTQTRQAAGSQQAAQRPIRPFPGKGRQPERAHARAVRHYTGLRYAAPARHGTDHGWRHGSSAESGHHRS